MARHLCHHLSFGKVSSLNTIFLLLCCVDDIRSGLATVLSFKNEAFCPAPPKANCSVAKGEIKITDESQVTENLTSCVFLSPPDNKKIAAGGAGLPMGQKGKNVYCLYVQ